VRVPIRLKSALIAAAATAAVAGFATPAFASANASPVVGYTYIDGNTATVNTIDGLARHADGSLTALPGSPFTAGGAGTGTGLASQGAIQVTRDGRYLLAVDAGSNQISVLRLTAGGVPVLAGQPVSSGGVTPVSVAVSPFGLVYVANQGNGGSGYSGFRLGFGGSLTPIAGSTVTVPDGSGVADVFFNAFGNHLAGTRAATSEIDSFVVLPDGHLLAAKGSPYTGSSRPPGPRSCSSATPTTAPPSVRSRPTGTACSASSPRSDPRLTRTGRLRRAGWRSATTASTCIPSTPPRGTSPAIPSSRMAPSS
jgi:hypothetical protein